MKKLINFCIVFGMAAIIGCSNEDGVTPPGGKAEQKVLVPAPELTVAEKAVATKVSSFGVDFLVAASKEAGDVNMAVSPYSVSAVLSMCANVADDATKEQIVNLLGTGDIEACNSLVKKNMEWLPDADAQVKMNIANGVWYEKEFSINPSFHTIATDVYKAEISPCYFASPDTRNVINAWVEKNTNNLIPDFIKAADPQTVAMFVNAIYFKGEWTKKFNPKETRKAKFNGISHAIDVDMMHKELKTRYALTDNCQAVWLGYGSGRFSMVCVLPNEDVSVDDLLAMDEMKKLYENSDSTTVAIDLPKFKIAPEYNTQLNTILASMGCENLSSLQNISIFAQALKTQFFFQQRVYIDVDEEGTEAAAATASGMTTSPGPLRIPKVQFNRPFIFMINEMNSNTCLFAGKVVDL